MGKFLTKTGIYWGRFDPPTLAHRAIAVSALEQLNLKQLLIVCNNNEEAEQYNASASDRISMFMSMIPTSLNSKIKFIIQTSSKILSYATIKNTIFCSIDKVIIIAGSDSFERNWYLSEQADMVAIIPRKLNNKASLEQLNKFIIQKQLGNIIILNIPPLHLTTSSTMVREAIKEQDRVVLNTRLHYSVKNFIQKSGIYN